jgi:hypothetical protein
MEEFSFGPELSISRQGYESGDREEAWPLYSGETIGAKASR